MLLNLPFSLFFFCLILIVSNKCGDFVIDAGETCDDGNTRSGDGCSSDCRVEYNYKCYNNTQKYSVCYISKPFSANLNYIPSTSPFELNLSFTKPFLKYDPEFIKSRINLTITELNVSEDFSWIFQSQTEQNFFKIILSFSPNVSFISKEVTIEFNNSDSAILDIFEETLGIGSLILQTEIPLYINYSSYEENFMIFMNYFITFVFFSMLFCFIPLSILNTLTVFWSFLGEKNMLIIIITKFLDSVQLIQLLEYIPYKSARQTKEFLNALRISINTLVF